MSPQRTALRYMAHFRCLADACPDTCCTGMQIQLSAEDVTRLEETVGPELTSAMAVADASLEAPSVATMAKDAHDTCTQLSPEGLCGIVRAHGEAPLPEPCANYPRVLSYFPGRVEVSGSLGCPEAARLCLGADGGLDVVEVDEAATLRLSAVRPSEHPEPYLRHVEQVRELAVALLCGPGGGIGGRLGALARTAAEIGGWFHRGAPDPGEEVLGERLRGAFADARGAGFGEAPSIDAPAGEVLAQTVLGLILSLQGQSSARYGNLVNGVLGTYQAAAHALEPEVGTPGGPALWPVLWRVFSQKSQRVERVLQAQVERWQSRVLGNEWYREWYTRAPNLLSYAFRLSLRGAVLRWLLVGHPYVDQVARALEAGELTLDPELEAELERAAIDSVQLFSRHLEGHRGVMELLEEQLSPESLGTDALGRALLFSASC